MGLIDLIDRSRLPRHIAIIMDGNGRWAQRKGEARIYGHRHAVTAVRAVTEGCVELDIPYLTLFAFSTENWSRPAAEIDALMELMVSTIHSELDNLIKNNIRLWVIGDLSRLPKQCRQEVEEAIRCTVHNSDLNLIIALNYGSRWEITQAMRTLGKRIEKGQLRARDITPELIASALTTAAFPDPELLIRTSGEKRLSNYLLWQLAYAELYFTPVLWPDFSKEHLFEAVLDFQRRERRFGKTSEQIRVL